MTTPNQKLIDDQLSKQIVDEMLAMPEEELKEIVRKRMGKINLSELEHEAIETKETKVNFVYMEADPDDVLALIRVVRAAQVFIKEYQELRDERMVSTTVEGELEEALKEVE